jgi:hypothetical protein
MVVNLSVHFGLQFLAAVTVRTAVVWVVVTIRRETDISQELYASIFRVERYSKQGEKEAFPLQLLVSRLTFISTLETEAIRSLETSEFNW